MNNGTAESGYDISIGFVRFVLIGLVLFIGKGLMAQQMLGLGFDNYNGAAGAALNPASLTNSKVYLDVNLITADFFLESNMGYFDKDSTSLWKLMQMARGHSAQNQDVVFIPYQEKGKQNLSITSRIQGPTIMLQDGRQAASIGIAFRTVSSGVNIPYQFVASQGRLSDSVLLHHSFDDNNFNISSLSWAEISLSYAYDLIEREDMKLTVGGSVKYLMGVSGAYIATKNFNFSVPNSKTLDIKNYDGEMGFALSVDYDDYNNPDFDPVFKGHGIGLDIGILYTKLKTFPKPGEKRLCAKPYTDYVYKIGVSLMDFGSIRFNNHTQVHQIDNKAATWEHFDTVQNRSINSTMRMISDVFYGSPTASLTGTSMNMSLPTTLSIQFDYHFRKNLYLGAYLQQPIRLRLKSIRQPPVLGIIPRYESRMFGASLPVVVYNYEKVRLGASLRFYSLTVGTENLGALFGTGDLTGMDFYFSMRFNLDKGSCLSYKKGACFNANK